MVESILNVSFSGTEEKEEEFDDEMKVELSVSFYGEEEEEEEEEEDEKELAERWIKLSQILPPEEEMGLGEAAELIDNVYGNDPCKDVDEEQEESIAAEPWTKEDAEENRKKQQEYWDKVKEYANLGLCDVEPTGDYTTQITVELSHAEGQYYLNVSGGQITKTVLQTSIRNEDRKNAESPARVYLVDIRVLGTVDGEVGDCTVTGTYFEESDEISLSAPSTDDATESDRDKYCPSSVWEIQEWEDEITCYETVTTQYKCECGGNLAYETVEEVTVSCPDDRNFKCLHQFSNWSSPYTDDDGNEVPGKWYCRYNMGDRTVLGGYIPCDIVLYDPMGNERARYEEISVMSEAWYYEERCCVLPEGSLPKCQTTYRKNPGDGKIDETRLSNYKARYGDKLDLIPVSPEDGDCGTIKTVVSDAAENCCDFVTQLVWDAENSAEVIADNSVAWVRVSNGRLPLTVSVRGSGFYLDASRTMRDAVVNSRAIRIFSANACGYCYITVTDGCSTVTSGIRSTNGNWVAISSPAECLGGYEVNYSSSIFEATAISGKYKHIQRGSAAATATIYAYATPYTCLVADPYATCDRVLGEDYQPETLGSDPYTWCGMTYVRPCAEELKNAWLSYARCITAGNFASCIYTGYCVAENEWYEWVC